MNVSHQIQIELCLNYSMLGFQIFINIVILP
jgi:hypothetical protein